MVQRVASFRASLREALVSSTPAPFARAHTFSLIRTELVSLVSLLPRSSVKVFKDGLNP